MAIGLYPKIASTTYDVKAVQVASRVRAAIPVIVQQQPKLWDSHFPSTAFVALQLPDTDG